MKTKHKKGTDVSIKDTHNIFISLEKRLLKLQNKAIYSNKLATEYLEKVQQW